MVLEAQQHLQKVHADGVDVGNSLGDWKTWSGISIKSTLARPNRLINACGKDASYTQ